MFIILCVYACMDYDILYHANSIIARRSIYKPHDFAFRRSIHDYCIHSRR